MVVEAIFQANLNADKIIMDLKYLSDPINHKFWLTIRNQTIQTLYFKLVCDIPNWSITSPTDGKLGSVESGKTSTFAAIISRSKPSNEVTESGNMTVEAYTDSEYTNKVAEAQLPVTVYIEDLESWPDVEISDFEDGTSQGWTLGNNVSIENDLSVEAGGYSARYYFRPGHDNRAETSYISKSVTLPNRNYVRLAFFFAVELYVKYANYASDFKFLNVQINGTKVFDIPFLILRRTTVGTQRWGWFKIGADLSEFKGQTVEIKIEWTAYVGSGYNHVKVWIDRIVIAGKD